jgi:uncharacterized coiled-coil protein SlyX
MGGKVFARLLGQINEQVVKLSEQNLRIGQQNLKINEQNLKISELNKKIEGLRFTLNKRISQEEDPDNTSDVNNNSITITNKNIDQMFQNTVFQNLLHDLVEYKFDMYLYSELKLEDQLNEIKTRVDELKKNSTYEKK